MIIAPGLHVEAILSPLARLNKKISPIAVRLTRADAAPGSTWTKNRAASLAQLPCPSSTCAVRGCTARAASAVPSSADRGLQVWDGVGLTLSLSVAWRSGSASCVRIRLRRSRGNSRMLNCAFNRRICCLTVGGSCPAQSPQRRPSPVELLSRSTQWS